MCVLLALSEMIVVEWELTTWAIPIIFHTLKLLTETSDAPC